MMEFNSLLTIECDCMIESPHCWGEFLLYITEDETKAMGLEKLGEWGWDLSDPDYHVCPYCSKGLNKEDVIPPKVRRIK
ncbi:MAG: hypothetical protein KA369_05820 [Spirochaetes bacterium]|nr:hypothetical protein [Spirochaetota bacterium]